jgi:SAM-dependent methyltransferase
VTLQTEDSCASFEWQWTQRTVHDYNGKIVADVGSGMGRLTWALAEMTRAREIISVELSPMSVAKERAYITDPRVKILQADIATVKFKADVIQAAGVIQHTRDPYVTLGNLIDNLTEGGELFISFYLRTMATQMLQPLRLVLSRLPKRMLWSLTPLLGPLFMVRWAGRESGYKTAMHSAYDWFGSHEFQYYFTDRQIRRLFNQCGIHPHNVIQIAKGLYKVKKGVFPIMLEEELRAF